MENQILKAHYLGTYCFKSKDKTKDFYKLQAVAYAEKDTKALLERCSKYPNFVISSGCDIPPATSLANLDAFCKAVQEF